MNFGSTSQNPNNNTAELPAGLTKEDIAALTNYPTIARFFDASRNGELKTLESKLSDTFQALERVILRGTAEDSRKAKNSADAIKIIIEFLEMLKQMRLKQQTK